MSLIAFRSFATLHRRISQNRFYLFLWKIYRLFLAFTFLFLLLIVFDLLHFTLKFVDSAHQSLTKTVHLINFLFFILIGAIHLINLGNRQIGLLVKILQNRRLRLLPIGLQYIFKKFDSGFGHMFPIWKLTIL